jgi:hypothetical protein
LWLHSTIDFDPYQERVIGLVIKPGHLTRSAVIVPINQVADATEHDVRLWLDCNQILSCPKFKEESPFYLEDQWYLVQMGGTITRSGEIKKVFHTHSSHNFGTVESQNVQVSKIQPAIRLHRDQFFYPGNRCS